MYKTQQVDYPLMFFFVAFFIIILGLFSKLSFQKQPDITSNVQKVVITTKEKGINEKIKSLNYDNPIQCSFTSKDSTISAQLEGTNLAVFTKMKSGETRLVLMEDCLYSWIEKERVGKKKCGLGQYVAIGKQLLGSGLASGDILDTAAKQIGKTLPVDIEAILESCNNVKEVKREGFMVPKNIEFK